MGYRSPYSCGFSASALVATALLSQAISDVCCPIAARDRPPNRPRREANLTRIDRKLAIGSPAEPGAEIAAQSRQAAPQK
jgi:hypothetical protein